MFSIDHQSYLEEGEEQRGKGSFPAMITPAYQNAKKANELASDVSTILEQAREVRLKNIFPETEAGICDSKQSQSRC